MIMWIYVCLCIYTMYIKSSEKPLRIVTVKSLFKQNCWNKSEEKLFRKSIQKHHINFYKVEKLKFFCINVQHENMKRLTRNLLDLQGSGITKF